MDLDAVIFMPSLAVAAVFSFVLILFLANYFLDILESTATGYREVVWHPGETLQNIWKFWYMLWLFGLWFGPGYLIAKAVAAGSGSDWVKLWLPIGIVWLLYPVSQLSSLSASTIWLPLVPDVFARLAQKPAVTLGFYLLSIPVLALFAVAFKWAFLTKGEWEMLFVGAPLVVLALFLYARLIGRLAFVLAFTKGFLQRKKKKKPRPDAEGVEEPPAEVEPTLSQPRDLPPLASPDGELTGYDVAFEEDTPRKRVVAELDEDEESASEGEKPVRTRSRPAKPPPLPPRRDPDLMPERSRVWSDEDDDEPTSYGVHAPEVVPVETTPEELVKPKESEMRLLSRDDVPKQPAAAWNLDLLAYLGQSGTVSAIVIASGLCFVVGVMVRICRDFNPLD